MRSGCPDVTSPGPSTPAWAAWGSRRSTCTRCTPGTRYTPIEETLTFLDAAVRAGKIHYVGLSNFTGWQIQKAVDVADVRGLVRPITLQPQYNLLAREVEWEIVPACQSEGLGLLPWSPLGGGWLTGKYRRDERPTGSTRLGREPQPRRGGLRPARRTRAHLGRARTPWTTIARSREISMAQVALAWLVDRPTVCSVILGARTQEQLDDNLGAAGVHLSDDEIRRLDQASDPSPADYPYGGPGVEQRSRQIAGDNRAESAARAGTSTIATTAGKAVRYALFADCFTDLVHADYSGKRPACGGLRPRRARRHCPQNAVSWTKLAVASKGAAWPAPSTHAHHAKVNDVVLAAVTGGLRELLASRGEDPKGVEQHVSRCGPRGVNTRRQHRSSCTTRSPRESDLPDSHHRAESKAGTLITTASTPTPTSTRP